MRLLKKKHDLEEDSLIGFSMDNMQVTEFIFMKIHHILAGTAQVPQHALQKCKN